MPKLPAERINSESDCGTGDQVGKKHEDATTHGSARGFAAWNIKLEQ